VVDTANFNDAGGSMEMPPACTGRTESCTVQPARCRYDSLSVRSGRSYRVHASLEGRTDDGQGVPPDTNTPATKAT